MKNEMLHIKFRYKDEMSKWQWRNQECSVSSVAECKRIYGLDNGDVEYEILSVVKEKNEKPIEEMVRYLDGSCIADTLFEIMGVDYDDLESCKMEVIKRLYHKYNK